MLNKIILVGRLTKDVEVRNVEGGEIVVFSLAFNTSKETTDFVDCVAGLHLANVVKENLVKGDKIAITGKFTNPSWTTKDGQTRRSPKIYVDDIEFIDVLKFQDSESKVEETPKQESKTRRR